MTGATVDSVGRVGRTAHIIEPPECRGEWVVGLGKTNGTAAAREGAPLDGRVAVDKRLRTHNR